MSLLPLSAWRPFDLRNRWIPLVFGTFYLWCGAGLVWKNDGGLGVVMLGVLCLAYATGVRAPPQTARPATWWAKLQSAALEP